MNTFAIITPAYNESAYIGQTIESVLAQTARPVFWLIVDDGSTDATGGIVKEYAQSHSFMHCHHRKKQSGVAYFSSNVFAIMEGYELIRNENIDFIAILDADIQLPSQYYEWLLQHFTADDKLGIASGVYVNLIDGKEHAVMNDRRSTPKSIMVFRRQVFDQIGGFMPLPHGGEDTIACVKARMAGWKVWSFPDIRVAHLRPTGTGGGKSILAARFRQGVAERSLATHPVFFLLKTMRRMVLEKPYAIGGAARLLGYVWAAVARHPTLVPPDVVRFLRREQVRRIIRGNSID